ncbi:hypothetical protein [Actinoplanes teichomyceticus]|uniref:Uncharacterized protein n=1 Tax=Actinoplanes teichomyceticus TaxID=1867 RepID=A0A561WAW4_ACTTI|nr:hypothetical protein [Actinoplanes teichomyceticus]TWG21008.1 hypothetical protein FHX34_103537 [Actinoplanes teichomyceticus]GIF14829.1 hypothetical protein Ate01nite_48610 [Actinoplanes teichomyceticus]
MSRRPRIVIDCPPNEDVPVGFDVKVQADDVTSESELVVLLLLVVEKLTGVSTDSYVRLVDECRRVAAREHEGGAR